ncbi:hypothetical protein SAMD00023353_0501540 [Rosellinia necatrix]|uniref:Uncharacterized protein n=1 Tax=Rosellinia necatrix TaxID=77044 RepID=A0A1S8A5N0_ROSNE|nr:hypothetical protein SAMD00023353_0501540 [Rosellinia necatrix]
MDGHLGRATNIDLVGFRPICKALCGFMRIGYRDLDRRLSRGALLARVIITLRTYIQQRQIGPIASHDSHVDSAVDPAAVGLGSHENVFSFPLPGQWLPHAVS